jgi:hypothetical protein
VWSQGPLGKQDIAAPYRSAIRTAINTSPDIMTGDCRRSVAEKDPRAIAIPTANHP